MIGSTAIHDASVMLGRRDDPYPEKWHSCSKGGFEKGDEGMYHQLRT